MKRKRATTIEERVTSLETELPHIYQELKEIKKQITNDIPHQIKALQASVDTVGRRYGDLDAISRFLSVVLKGLAAVLGGIWAFKQILR